MPYKQKINDSNITLKLLKTIGSPFTPEEYSKPLNKAKIRNLYSHSKINRIPLLFLDVLDKKNSLYNFKNNYRNDYFRYMKIFDTMAQVTEFLNLINMEHAIFKSIKPFPDASVDVDTIIFSSEKYDDMLRQFNKTEWKILEYGPQSSTFFDTKAQVGIDLYKEIAVSWVIYLDKEKLRRYVTYKMLPNKKKVFTLHIEADLISTIAHSIIKEQMFTLAEYYAFLIWLKAMSNNQIENFKELIELNNLLYPVKSFVTLSTLLHKEAFNFIPNKLTTLSNYLGKDKIEENRLIQNNFQMPHKYHFFTLFRSIMNKLECEKTRTSFAVQGLNMMNPSFTKRVVIGIVNHITRTTY